MRDTGTGEHFVSHVDTELTFLHDEAKKVENVARVKGAGIGGALGGQVQRRHQCHSAERLRQAGDGEFAVAAGGRGEVDKDGAGAHGLESHRDE